MLYRTMIWAVAALSFAATGNVGRGQLALFQQPRTIGDYFIWGSFESPDGMAPLVYDDFTLGENADVAIVNWQGTYSDADNPANNPEAPQTVSFSIGFWTDDGGQPGSPLSTQVVPFASTNAVLLDYLANNQSEYSFSAKLPVPFPAVAGTQYWLSIQAIDTADQPVWAWISGSGGDSISYQDLASGRNLRTSDRCFTLALAHPAFFDGEADLGGGAYYLSFASGNYFGYYSYLTDPDYIYHFDLGYEYVFDANDGKGGIYLYDFTSSDFFYTSPAFPFPYLFDFGLNSVVYYYPDPSNAGHYNTNGVRYFYVVNTGQIISK